MCKPFDLFSMNAIPLLAFTLFVARIAWFLIKAKLRERHERQNVDLVHG
jgi:hypothetical protein